MAAILSRPQCVKRSPSGMIQIITVTKCTRLSRTVKQSNRWQNYSISRRVHLYIMMQSNMTWHYMKHDKNKCRNSIWISIHKIYPGLNNILKIVIVCQATWQLYPCCPPLTHWVRDKMAASLQTTFSNAFFSMKMFEFWLKFHWNMFLRVQLTISEHRFR